MESSTQTPTYLPEQVDAAFVMGTLIEPEGEPQQLALELPDQFEKLFLGDWNSTFDLPVDTQHKVEVYHEGKHGKHLVSCAWSDDNARCGPDTCGCGRKTLPEDKLYHIEKMVQMRHKAAVQEAQRQEADRARDIIAYLSKISRVALGMGHRLSAIEVLTKIETEARGKPKEGYHACIFGYMPGGDPLQCHWCPSSETRKYLCTEMARHVKAWLNRHWGVEETCDDQKVLAKQKHAKKQKGIKKFDQVRYLFKKKRQTDHTPYWNVAEIEEKAKMWTITSRAQQLLSSLKGMKVDKKFRPKKNWSITLEEALQCRYMVTAKSNPHGLFEKNCSHTHKANEKFWAQIDSGRWENIEDLDLEYAQQEMKHKSKNPHHPDTLNRQQTWFETFETMLDLLASSMKLGGDIVTAYERVWDWIAYLDRGQLTPLPKYKNLDPIGILVFLEVVRRRGLSQNNVCDVQYREKMYKTYHMLCHDKMLWQFAGDALKHPGALNDAKPDKYESDRIALDILGKYMDTLNDHMNLVNDELNHYRLPGKHDLDKTNYRSVIAYAWHWAQPVEHTMFKSPTAVVSDGISEGVAAAMENPEVKSGLSETIAEAFKPYLERVTGLVDKLDINSERITSNVETCTETFAGLSAKLENSLDGIASQMGSLFAGVTQTAGQFGDIAVMIKSFIAKIGSFIPGGEEGSSWLGMPANWWDKVDVAAVLSLCQIYILYCHCNSKIVKSLLVLIALKQLGLLTKVMEGIKWCWNQCKNYVDHTSSGDEAETWFEYLGTLFEDFNVKKASFLCGLLVCVLCGVTAPFSCLKKMGKSVMHMLTNMHYVGLGLFGAKRIFEYLQTTFTVVFDYIKEHVFGIKPAEKANVVEIGQWAARVKFFVTEEGVQMIRTSKEALEEASKLYPRGVELFLQTQKDEKWAGREMTRLVATLQKDALVVHNVVFRIRNYTSFRPTMFHVQLVGEPGIGKSTLTGQMVAVLKDKLFQSHPDQNLVYTLGDTDHYDGYSGQLFIVGDDLWKYNDAKHATAIIGLITNTPVLLPMAHLEDKGTYLDSEIMISSVNNAYPDFKDVLCQDALRRRRHVLAHVEIDKDVLDKATHKYDDKLWEKKYQGKERKDFPHLRFHLLKPLPDSMDPHEKGVIDMRENYYTQNDELPKGLTVPLRDLTFSQFMTKVEARYRAMREEEKRILPKEKRQRMQQDWAEIDHAIDVCYGGQPTSKFLEGLFLPAEIPSPLGETVQQEEVANSIAENKPETRTLEAQATSIFSGQIIPELDTIVNSEACAEVSVDEIIAAQQKDYVNQQRCWHPMITHARDNLGRRYHVTNGELCSLPASDEVVAEHTAGDSFVTAEDAPQLSQFEQQRRARFEARANAARARATARTKEEETPLITTMRTINGRKHLLLRTNYAEEDIAIGRYNMAGQKGDQTTEEWRARKQLDLIHQAEAADFDTGVKRRQQSPAVSLGDNPVYGQTAHAAAKNLTLDFVRKLQRVDGEWYYDLTDVDFGVIQTAWAVKLTNSVNLALLRVDVEAAGFQWDSDDWAVYEHGGRQMVISLAGLALADAKLLDQIKVFLEEFNLEQQQVMVQETKTFWQVCGEKFWALTSGRFGLGKIRSWMNLAFRKVRRFALWFWEHCIAHGNFVMTGMLTIIVITWCRMLGSLFTPTVEETSKVLFKGRGGRPLIHVTHTSGEQKQFQDQTDSLIRRNLAYMEVDGKSFAGIKSGQYIYTVYHGVRKAVAKGAFMLRFLPTYTSDKLWEVEIQPHHVCHMPQTDFCVIYSPCLPEARNVDEWYFKEKDLKTFQGGEIAHIYFQQGGYANMVMRTPKHVLPAVDFCSTEGWDGVYNWMIAMNSMAVKGSSGGPCLTVAAMDGAKRIIGLQSINKAPHAFVQGVTQEMLEACKNNLKYERSRVVMMGPVGTIEETCAPVAAQYITEHLDVVGAVPKDQIAGMLGKTKFEKTLFAERFVSEHVPAIVQKKDPRVPQGQHPLAHSVNKFGRDVMKWLPQNLLEQSIVDVSRYIRGKIGSPKLRTLEFQEIVCGHDHEGSGPMNLDTSMGLPWVNEKYPNKPGGKKAYFHKDQDGNMTWIDPRVIREFEETDASMRLGVVPPSSMYEFAKDELRPKEKALGLNGTPIKSRSISVMNCVQAMMFRKYNLDLTAHMHVAADGRFQSCVGINPEGPEWMVMYECLSEKSFDKCFDLDVGNWDGHFTPQLFFAVVKTINRIYDDMEGSENATARYAIAHAALFGYDQFEDACFKKMRGMPSGFGGTAIYNTIGHMLLFYVWWLMLAHSNGLKTMANFNAYLDSVCVRLYGDDVVCSVIACVSDWFNADTVAELYSQFGWPTTTAAKTGGMGSFQSLVDVQFLKRKFVFDEDYGPSCIHGKIDISVVVNLLSWMRVSAKTDKRKQLYENINSAFQFLFPYGEETYERMLNEVNHILAQNGMDMYYISYTQMREYMLAERFGLIE
uniref:Putative replicase n=1 Tax=Nuksystermes virus TaxID=2796622 RepID=A0A894KLQ9_9VIRU|nr:putative replicase [Nuksystermes virus]